jgi:transcriptional regulator with XRE-family HTH domain
MKRRATVHDVAREAGVSLATVDRVLNGRAGVRAATAEKVEAAIKSLGFSRDLNASLMARARDLSVVFFIPDGSNEFMDSLADAVTRRFGLALADRIHLETRRIKPLDSAGLARSLDSLDARNCDCAVIVTSEEPEVIAAVDAAHRRGIAVMTLVSDLPNSARRNFIGIDNVAAGRTAASLLGRFLPFTCATMRSAWTVSLPRSKPNFRRCRSSVHWKAMTSAAKPRLSSKRCSPSIPIWPGSIIWEPVMPDWSKRSKLQENPASCASSPTN